jgi:CHAD domain-containing protein
MATTTLPANQLLLGRLEQALRDQWRELLQQRQLVLDSWEQEAIHDLRVASRRLRTVLELLPPWIGSKRMRRLRRPIRSLTRELGRLRNLDETRKYLTGLQDKALLPLMTQLEQQRRQERKRVRRLLEELPLKRLHQQLERAGQCLHTSTGSLSGTVVSRLAARNLDLFRPIHQLQLLPELAEQAEQRHTLRIAVKKWRYFNELLTQLWGGRQDRLLVLLKQYQTLLGDLNDREVFLSVVSATSGLAPQARERMMQAIEAQHRQLVSEFRQLLTRQPLQYHFEQ